MPAIEIKDLSKTYEYYKKPPGLREAVKSFFIRKRLFSKAVKNVSFNINEGELVGFLGPNGAGKTTILKMLSGIICPTGGSVRVLGFDPWKRQSEYQKQFALVMGQKNQLWTDLPAMESFVLNRDIYQIPKKEFDKKLDELVEMLGVKDCLDVQVRKLSLGQRMKCELIAALLHNPKVLLLDEPTIGLDVVAQKNIRDFIKRQNERERTTIILTSHYMEDISQLCKRIIIINLGEIIYDGELESLIRKYAPYKLLSVTFNGNGIERKDVERFGTIHKFDRFNAILRVDRAKVKDSAKSILSSELPVDDIIIDEEDVDDIIREIFNK
ncbi:MAG: ATP-binding cassette domain-containing protein [Candidatus Paceibacterota bacterium]|jgi:ABC-2 type transport system ATP-binding protein